MNDNATINVTSWVNSTPNIVRGTGYGIRVLKCDFDKVQNWNTIVIDDTGFILEREKKAFKVDCPEIRSYLFGLYFQKLGKLKWPRGKPYIYKLTHLGEEKFKLHL
jgi:hypothetical protein